MTYFTHAPSQLPCQQTDRKTHTHTQIIDTQAAHQLPHTTHARHARDALEEHTRENTERKPNTPGHRTSGQDVTRQRPGPTTTTTTATAHATETAITHSTPGTQSSDRSPPTESPHRRPVLIASNSQLTTFGRAIDLPRLGSRPRRCGDARDALWRGCSCCDAARRRRMLRAAGGCCAEYTLR